MSDWLRGIGLNILSARKRAGKNQDDLGVSPVTIGKLEAGHGGNLTTLEKIARALGVHPNIFFGTSTVIAQKETAHETPEVAVIKTPQQQVIWGVIQQLHGKDLSAFQKIAVDFLNATHSRRGVKHQPRRGLHRRQ